MSAPTVELGYRLKLRKIDHKQCAVYTQADTTTQVKVDYGDFAALGRPDSIFLIVEAGDGS